MTQHSFPQVVFLARSRATLQLTATRCAAGTFLEHATSVDYASVLHFVSSLLFVLNQMPCIAIKEPNCRVASVRTHSSFLRSARAAQIMILRPHTDELKSLFQTLV